MNPSQMTLLLALAVLSISSYVMAGSVFKCLNTARYGVCGNPPYQGTVNNADSAGLLAKFYSCTGKRKRDRGCCPGALAGGVGKSCSDPGPGVFQCPKPITFGACGFWDQQVLAQLNDAVTADQVGLLYSCDTHHKRQSSCCTKAVKGTSASGCTAATNQ